MAENENTAPPPETQTATPPLDNAAGGAPPSNPPAEAPAWLPKKFLRNGAPDFEALATSYSHLEKRQMKAGEDAVAAHEAKRLGSRPGKSDDYQISMPASLPDGLVVLEEAPPEGFTPEPGKAYVQLNKADPLYQMARKMAFEAGLSQEQFSGLLGEYATMVAVQSPTAEQVAAQRADFYKSLGDAGQERVAHTWAQLNRFVTGDHARAIDDMMRTKEGFEAVEALVAKAQGAGFMPRPASAPSGVATENELRAIMRDPKYLTDKALQEKVERGYQALYGGEESSLRAPFAR